MKPVEQTPARLELLLKLTFAKNIPAEYMIAEMKKAKHKCMKGLEECLKREQELISNEKAREDSGYPYWLATVRYGIDNAWFRIKWCEETIESIKAHKK
ncbi:hypothetical protein CEB3_c02580 [Peptococcaceae bacterium CEB3]|nr:hypothetical protein CEB3_c02580 [Peptococcaceae bacterium CEB3]